MIYNDKEVEILREGGRRLAVILKEVSDSVMVGITTLELNTLAEKLVRDGGDVPAFLNYKPEGAKIPYPASLCVSVNDEVVHGIPSNRTLEDGDIIGLDLGLIHNGLVVDMAVTIPVGDVSESDMRLINTTHESLMAGIKAARAGGNIGDIGYAVENVAKAHSHKVIESLGGHGVGRHVHEDPYIPNVGKKGTGDKLENGMVLALEPMLSEGGKDVILDKDGFTFRTRDGARSAHFEHTILVTGNGSEILTKEESDFSV